MTTDQPEAGGAAFVTGASNGIVASTDKLAQRCAPCLPPGSEIRQVYICQAAPNP
jgi:hypothetical protein